MISCLGKRHRLIKFFCNVAQQTIERETMEYDVLVVGGGVAGLSTAIKIKQLSAHYDRPLSVCVI